MSADGLPPTERIVHALWRAGKVRDASELAKHALARRDASADGLKAQLSRLGRGEQLLPLPPLELDFALVVGLVERHRLHEAQTLLRATGLSRRDPRGRRLASVLADALSPLPADADPTFAAALHLVRAGQAPSALRALEEVVRLASAPPAWLQDRRRALSSLVRSDWWHAPEPVEAVTRDTVLARIRKRDLRGALKAAHEADAKELTGLLQRLVDVAERAFSDPNAEGDDPRTVPMEGRPLAQFHVGMGMLAQADAVYRAVLEEDWRDDDARVELADVIAVRRALGEEVDDLPPREISSVHWLDKNRAPRKADWGPGGRSFPAPGDEKNTDVLDAAEEAELLLDQGRAHEALDMYRILSIRHPNQRRYLERIGEIEALVAQGLAEDLGDITAPLDLTELPAEALPTDPQVVITGELAERYPAYEDGDDAGQTLVDTMPDDD